MQGWDDENRGIAMGLEQQQVATQEAQATGQRAYVVSHPLQLRSAYQDCMGREPEITSCHNKFEGTVDYIFYTPQVGPHC